MKFKKPTEIAWEDYSVGNMCIGVRFCSPSICTIYHVVKVSDGKFVWYYANPMTSDHRSCDSIEHGKELALADYQSRIAFLEDNLREEGILKT